MHGVLIQGLVQLLFRCSFRVFSFGVCSFGVYSFRVCSFRVCSFRVCSFRVSFNCSFRCSFRCLFRCSFRVSFSFRMCRSPESWYFLSRVMVSEPELGVHGRSLGIGLLKGATLVVGWGLGRDES